MIGFDDKALILFPYLENYESKKWEYKRQFTAAVDNLCKYLKTIGIKPHVFYSDDVARTINHKDFVWVSTLGKADSFFASNNCIGMSEALTKPTVKFDELYNKIIAKDQGSMDMTVQERFDMVVRHSNKAISKIIPSYKIVISFQFKTKLQYKVASKIGDNKIRIYVDAQTLAPDSYIGGMQVSPIDLLNISCANRSLDLWRINDVEQVVQDEVLSEL